MKSQEKKRRESVVYKNYARMRLLIMLPSFQKAVAEVREKRGFSIPSGSFQESSDAYRWLNDKGMAYVEGMPDGFYKKPSQNGFRDAIKEIGSRFHLPFNFTSDSGYGIAWYVLTGQVKFPESNWAIEYPLLHETKAADWVGIRAFLPLSKEEMKDAMSELRKEQKLLMSKHLTYARRTKKHLEEDLEILEYVSKRTGMPRRLKQYLKHSYPYYRAAAYRRNPTEYQKKELKRAEKNFPSDVSIGYDQPLIKDIARKLKITKGAARQALKRLNDDAVKMFGRGFFARRDDKGAH